MMPWSERSAAAADDDGVVRLLRIGAYALCRDGGRLLCCRLAPDQPSPGSWTLPGGGIEFGEHPEAAVLRELAEETGLAGRVVAIATARSRVYPGQLPDGRRRELQAVALVYRVAITGGTLRDEPAGSTDRAAWLDERELRELRLTRMLRAAAEESFGGLG